MTRIAVALLLVVVIASVGCSRSSGDDNAPPVPTLDECVARCAPWESTPERLARRERLVEAALAGNGYFQHPYRRAREAIEVADRVLGLLDVLRVDPREGCVCRVPIGPQFEVVPACFSAPVSSGVIFTGPGCIQKFEVTDGGDVPVGDCVPVGARDGGVL